MTFVRPGDRIAVTGATGFVGQTLVEQLTRSGYEVVGISEHSEPPSRISTVLYDYHQADLAHAWPKLAPVDGIVHLAGLAAVGPSFGCPQEYISTNSAMVTHLFEHALAQEWTGRALVVSSGGVYGGTDGSEGLTEDSPCLATSPYVVSKLLVEKQSEYYRQRGLDALVVRPFNHIGPGQRLGFIVPDLMAKVVAWQPDEVLVVGNLESARDYTDVRDIARAYELLLERSRPRETTYNVCSGFARSGWEVLKAVCTALGKPLPPVEVTDRRAIDPSVISGSAERLNREMGWRPTIEFQTSINDFAEGMSQNNSG